MPKALYAGRPFLPEAIILGLVLSFIITPFVRRLALRNGIVDIPRDGRRMHKSAVPLAGGAGMIAAFLVSLAFFGGQPGARPFPLAVFCLLCGVYGVFDDKFALPARAKLAFQLFAGAASALVFTFLFLSSITTFHRGSETSMRPRITAAGQMHQARFRYASSPPTTPQAAIPEVRSSMPTET